MRIAVEFKDIQLNTNLQLMAGEVKTTYDPEWKNVLDVNEVVGDVNEVADAVSDLYNNIKEFLNNYKGTEEDKKKAGEFEKQQIEVYNLLMEDEDLSTDEKAELKTIQVETKKDWEDLKTANACADDEKPNDIKKSNEQPQAEKPKSFKCKTDKIKTQAAVVKKQNEKSIEKKKTTPIVILVNGYWNTGFLQKDLLGFSDGKLLDEYWGKDLKSEIKRYFFNIKDINLYYINGASDMTSNGNERYNNGLQFVTDRLKNKFSKFQREVTIKNRKILVVSHSMGAAFAEGLVHGLNNNNIQPTKIVHLSPADNSDFNITLPEKTFQIDISVDPVLAFKNLDDKNQINRIKNYGLIQNPDKDLLGHANTKLEAYVWHWFEDLELVNFEFKGLETETITTPSSGLGYGGTTTTTKYESYNAKNLKYNTIFKNIIKNGKSYFYSNTNKKYQIIKK